MRLANGTEVADPRLGRIVEYDPRMRAFPIRPTIHINAKPRSMTWFCTTYLDQGNVGACVGFAVAHEAIARPDVRPNVSHATAMQIYKRAQQLDPWPGEDYEGTSVLAGVKAGFELGFYREYRWALTFEDLVLGVGHHGAAILGINWYSSMYNLDSNGFIHVNGSVAGGHSLLAVGVNVPEQKFRLHNSWGKSWGIRGDAFISFDDMRRLFVEQGEAVFPTPPTRAVKMRFP